MFDSLIQAVAALAVGMLLELFKRWLNDHKHTMKKRSKRHK